MPTTRTPLEGFRILELGQYIAVPGATQILADQGATVVKVEPPGGEPARRLPGYGQAMAAAYNRGKHCIELDLKTEDGRAAVHRLAMNSDAVVANMRPASLTGLGLDASALRAERPELVHVSLTGFGSEGALRSRAGLDIAAQAEAGIMWVTGESGREPQRVGFPVVDAAATFAIAQAVSTALLAQMRDGVGATIDLSLWDVAFALQAPNWLDYALTGEAPERSGNGQPTAAPAAELVEVADGWIVLSAYTADHWRRLCELIDAPELLTDPRFATSLDRVRHREEMHRSLSGAFGAMTRADAVATLSNAGLVCGSVNSYPEAMAQRKAQPASPFVDMDVDVAGDEVKGPPWLLGPLTTWWGDVAITPPRAAGADNTAFDSLVADRDMAPTTLKRTS